MRIELSDKNLTSTEKTEIEKLLSRENNSLSDDLEQMWYLMNLIWGDCHCDNKKLNWENIGRFYSHPVWLLNGLYIEQDNVSMGHRHAISDWVIKKGFSKVVDYGGGFGTLARLIAEKNVQIQVDIYEPHPSEFGLKRAEQFNNIKMVDNLGAEYECLLSTDVLEHVPDPLADFSKMIDSVQVGGYLIIANCFYPVIKCHLPHDFHFRYSFNLFAKIMGLKVEGVLESSHATIFKKIENKKVNWYLVRSIEFVSKSSFPVINFLLPVLRPVKKLLSR